MKASIQIITICVSALLLAACSHNSNKEDNAKSVAASRYTLENAIQISISDPEQALMIVDSAEMLGNASAFYAELTRAKVYYHGESLSSEAQSICQKLLEKKDLSLEQQADVLSLLVAIANGRQDDEMLLKYSTQYLEICRLSGDNIEMFVTQANIGEVLIRLGRTEEGFEKIDDAINQLYRVHKFSEMDACIRCLKRKIRSLEWMGRMEEIIPVAQSILEMLQDFADNPSVYNDLSPRMPDEEMIPVYIDYYTGQAYGFLAYSYATLPDSQAQARHYCQLYEQTDYGNSFDGRKLISSTWCKLGYYPKMLTFYDELEAKWGDDTMHHDYAILLYNRAIAAQHYGHLEQCIDYLNRYASLNNELNKSERTAAAQEYAARFREQEHLMALEQEKHLSHRNAIIAGAMTIIAVLVAFFAMYLNIQARSIRRKNAALKKEITDRIAFEKKYLTAEGHLAGDTGKPTVQKELTPAELAALSDKELFNYLRHYIVDNKLFTDSRIDRQYLMDHLHLSKDRLGAAFAQGSEYNSLTAFLNEVRLIYSTQLLTNQPEMSVADVATACGFTSNSLYTRNFKKRYALTPSEFRKKQK
ncbi:MAG: helix-turn-helix domain-containing protein [Bacteroidales bacterium]|nr:helix-turn-helix domain-containing protein [Bacteroidales bacterium]